MHLVSHVDEIIRLDKMGQNCQGRSANLTAKEPFPLVVSPSNNRELKCFQMLDYVILNVNLLRYHLPCLCIIAWIQ